MEKDVLANMPLAQHASYQVSRRKALGMVAKLGLGGAAAAALGGENAHACDEEPGVDGNGHVLVSFAPDGTVQNADVDSGGNERTPRGACIAAQFKKARVPPFAGAPVRVGKTFTTGTAAR